MHQMDKLIAIAHTHTLISVSRNHIMSLLSRTTWL